MSQSARRSCDADYPLMLIIPSGVKIHMALGHTDMRNYAERAIMRSTRPSDLQRALLSTT
jgi:hypothetical protein